MKNVMETKLENRPYHVIFDFSWFRKSYMLSYRLFEFLSGVTRGGKNKYKIYNRKELKPTLDVEWELVILYRFHTLQWRYFYNVF